MSELLEHGQAVGLREISNDKRNIIPKLIRNLEQIHQQVFDRFVLLELFDHLIYLPDGIAHLVDCLQGKPVR